MVEFYVGRGEADVSTLFRKCLRTHVPSAMRGGLGVVRLRDTLMNHLGGLDEVKLMLKQYVEWPLKYPNKFRKLGIRVPKGLVSLPMLN